MTKKQYSYCVAGLILFTLLVICQKGQAEEPAVQVKTPVKIQVMTTLPAPTIADLVKVSNAPCPESLKAYGKYGPVSTSSTCGVPGKRYRPWICNDRTRGKGIDIEHIPAVPCARSLYDILLEELGGN